VQEFDVANIVSAPELGSFSLEQLLFSAVRVASLSYKCGTYYKDALLKLRITLFLEERLAALFDGGSIERGRDGNNVLYAIADPVVFLPYELGVSAEE
jgi:hypothetical protein